MRQGCFLIINGVVNSIQASTIESITDTLIGMVEETIQDAIEQKYRFDTSCRRLAVGIIQDVITGLQDKAKPFAQRIMTLLNVVLESEELTIDVKNFAIGGLGYLCLNCEMEFFEFLDKTMASLIQAGQASLQCNL